MVDLMSSKSMPSTRSQHFPSDKEREKKIPKDKLGEIAPVSVDNGGFIRVSKRTTFLCGTVP